MAMELFTYIPYLYGSYPEFGGTVNNMTSFLTVDQLDVEGSDQRSACSVHHMQISQVRMKRSIHELFSS